MSIIILLIAIVILVWSIISIISGSNKSCALYEIEEKNFTDKNGNRKFKSINEARFFDFLLLSHMKGSDIYEVQLDAFRCGFFVTYPTLKKAIDLLVKDGFLKSTTTVCNPSEGKSN